MFRAFLNKTVEIKTETFLSELQASWTPEIVLCTVCVSVCSIFVCFVSSALALLQLVFDQELLD